MVMKAVCFDKYGAADVLKVDNVLKPKPEEDEVLVRVSACGVNREDIWRRTSYFSCQSDRSSLLGHECSGYIVERGSKVVNFEIFDKVCALVRGGGAYGEYVAVPESCVIRYPDCISSEQAASLPQAMCLVLYCFQVLRQINSGQTVLIHGAGGGVGVIALQYAKSIGCHVFVTVGTDEKMIRCKDLGAKDCINRNKGDFCKILKDRTGGTGVDVILDVSGSKYLNKNLDCLAKGGVLFLIGLKSGSKVDLDFSILKTKDVEVIGASLFAMPPLDLVRLLRRAEDTFWPLIRSGQVEPVVGKTFMYSEAASAHRAMENHSVFGKVILVPDPEDA